MRIGMIAPISHPYPPPGYGPWERVTHDLTEQLVARGHDVTLYAAADSKTHARLFPTVDRSLETLPAEQRQDVEDRHIAAALDHMVGMTIHEGFTETDIRDMAGAIRKVAEGLAARR